MIRFLDALFLSLDACFRLKRRNISSHAADPGLSLGFSYFVEETKLVGYLENFKDEVEPVRANVLINKPMTYCKL